jgi:IS605 OrfB family transposase
MPWQGGRRTTVIANDSLCRHVRITDRRRDHLHKLTTRLVRENQAVVIEDLQVRNMVCNHSLARAISDAAWRELRGMVDVRSAPRRYGEKSTQGRRDSGSATSDAVESRVDLPELYVPETAAQREQGSSEGWRVAAMTAGRRSSWRWEVS